MVGSAVMRQLESGFEGEVLTRTRTQLDLCDQRAVSEFFAEARPDCVVFAAAKVGGIHANATYPAEFAYDNIMMAANAIHAAYRNQTERFLFLGSTCIYPRDCPQPIQESSLLTGPLEPTNEAYALAKIAGLKLCQHYRSQYGVMFHSAMPTNLYGPGDNYHPDNSHVIPGLIRRFHDAQQAGEKQVSVWGSGKPRREFLHVDDLATAVVHLIGLENPPDWVNVGTGVDLPIAELATLIARTVGFDGEIVQDASKPDGTPVKRTDTTLINGTGWSAQIDLIDGLQSAYQDFLHSIESQQLRSL